MPSPLVHLTRLVFKTVMLNLLFASLLAASFLIVRAAAGDAYLVTVPHVFARVAPAPVKVAELVDEHDCWSGEAPADMRGVLPGHVVVTVGLVSRVGGDRLVGQALEQIFDGVDHGLTVHGFCR